MSHHRTRLLLVPLLLLALLPAGCFGLPVSGSGPGTGTGSGGTSPGGASPGSTPIEPAISLQEASTEYGEIMCELLANTQAFGVATRDPASKLPDINAAAALLQHHLESAAARLRGTVWPDEVAADLALLADIWQGQADSMTALVEATTSEELAAAAASTNAAPDSGETESRLEAALQPPACANPDIPHWRVEDLRQEYLLAGGDCPDAEWELTSYPPAKEAGNCRTSFLAVYTNVADRDLGVRAFEIALTGGVLDLLVGPNWVLGAESPARFAERLGGTVVDVP